MRATSSCAAPAHSLTRRSYDAFLTAVPDTLGDDVDEANVALDAQSACYRPAAAGLCPCRLRTEPRGLHPPCSVARVARHMHDTACARRVRLVSGSILVPARRAGMAARGLIPVTKLPSPTSVQELCQHLTRAVERREWHRAAAEGLLNVRSSVAPKKDKDVRNTMIDRIRQDIQERLDQLLAEADRLRPALTALGGERRRPRRADEIEFAIGLTDAHAQHEPPRRARALTSGSAVTDAGASASSRSRGSAGGTKSSVLKALADANGGAMTASEVASATGLGRASVSTTLSKLAKSGDVTKAQPRISTQQGGASGSTVLGRRRHRVRRRRAGRRCSPAPPACRVRPQPTAPPVPVKERRPTTAKGGGRLRGVLGEERGVALPSSACHL